MTDIVIALIFFAPFIICFIGAIVFAIGEESHNKKLKKVAEYIVGFGSSVGLLWILLILVFAVPEIRKVHHESIELRKSFHK